MSEILIGSTSDPNEATVLPETPEKKQNRFQIRLVIAFSVASLK
jgi:hypothetical protein